MTRIDVAFELAATAAVAITAWCGGESERTAGGSAPAASAPAATAQAGTPVLDITLKTDPDPVRMGENTFGGRTMTLTAK